MLILFNHIIRAKCLRRHSVAYTQVSCNGIIIPEYHTVYTIWPSDSLTDHHHYNSPGTFSITLTQKLEGPQSLHGNILQTTSSPQPPMALKQRWHINPSPAIQTQRSSVMFKNQRLDTNMIQCTSLNCAWIHGIQYCTLRNSSVQPGMWTFDSMSEFDNLNFHD